MALPATKTVVAMKDTSNADLTIKATGFQWKWGYDYLKGEGEGIGFLSTLRRRAARDVRRPRKPKGERLPARGRQPAGRAGQQEGPHHHHRQRRDPRLVACRRSASSRTRSPASCATPGSAPRRSATYRGQCDELCGKEHALHADRRRRWCRRTTTRVGRRARRRRWPPQADDPNKVWDARPTSRRAARRSTPPTARPATRPTARACRPRSAARRLADRASAPTRRADRRRAERQAAAPRCRPWKQLSRHRHRRRHHLHQRTTGATRPAQIVQPAEVAGRAASNAATANTRTSIHERSHRPRPRRTATATTTTTARPHGLTRWVYDDQPQGHRHAVPVVLVHHVHGRRRAGADDPRRAVPARACSSSTPSSSTSSPRCTA